MNARPTSPGEGYTYASASPCRGCGRLIHWWITPRDRRGPYDADGTSHFATCPAADKFKRATPPRSKP